MDSFMPVIEQHKHFLKNKWKHIDSDQFSVKTTSKISSEWVFILKRGRALFKIRKKIKSQYYWIIWRFVMKIKLELVVVINQFWIQVSVYGSEHIRMWEEILFTWCVNRKVERTTGPLEDTISTNIRGSLFGGRLVNNCHKEWNQCSVV